MSRRKRPRFEASTLKSRGRSPSQSRPSAAHWEVARAAGYRKAIPFLCEGRGRQAHAVAFYFPGEAAPCDRLCGAEYLGNFFLHPHAPIRLHGAQFICAEAAYQAMKRPTDCLEAFQGCTGQEAFDLSRSLPSKAAPDRLKVMESVLRQKFPAGSALAKQLIETKNLFLQLGDDSMPLCPRLEHNSARRDDFWSDNFDGSGKNWLGALLMLQRFQLMSEEDEWRPFLQRNLNLELQTTSSAWDSVVRQARQGRAEREATTSCG